MSDLLEEARRSYAEELRFTARLGSRAVIDAFATVPRERFFGPGPWRLLSPVALGDYWTTEDADPRHLYHDVLIAIDEERRLNNGQPSLWAHMYDNLDLRGGAHVVHVGAGTGYVIIAPSLPRSLAALAGSPPSRSTRLWLREPAAISRNGPRQRSLPPTVLRSVRTGRLTRSLSMPA
jgi:hypothetical protein